jgi:hypothetical protein
LPCSLLIIVFGWRHHSGSEEPSLADEREDLLMAEHFYGRQHTVHFSNGAAEGLLGAWIKIGEQMQPTPHAEAVLAFLRGRLRLGDGWRAFALHPPPPELTAPDRLRCLAAMVAGFTNDLATGRPDPEPGVSWNRDLELLWLARMLDLYTLINEALPAEAEPLAPLTPALTPCDRARCEYYRLSDRLAELRRQVERSPAPRDHLRAELGLVDQLLTALAGQESTQQRDAMTAHHLVTRSDLLLKLGDRAGGITALHEAAAVEPDAEMRQALADYIAELAEGSEG